MVSFRTMLAAGAAALAVSGLAAAPAAAGTVTVTYTCVNPSFIHNRTMHVEITAPAMAARGATVTLQASLTDDRPSAQSFKAGDYHGVLVIELGGAGTGSGETTGLATPDIAQGTPFRLVGGRAQVTLTNPGDVTFRPGRWWLYNPNTGLIFYKCAVRSGDTAGIAATTRVNP